MKKRLFPFFAEAAGVKHKARYSQRAFKPTGHTWVHGTRQEAPKGAVELCGVTMRSFPHLWEIMAIGGAPWSLENLSL